jgi:hypothetical protein
MPDTQTLARHGLAGQAAVSFRLNCTSCSRHKSRFGGRPPEIRTNYSR